VRQDGPVIPIPAALAAATIAREGQPGKVWIDRLPDLAGSCLRRWKCQRDGAISHGGVALIIPVRSPYGPAVIKISFRHPGNVDEPLALRTWQGNGAVRLYESAPDDLAMLLERAGRPLDLPDVDEVLIIGGRLSKQLAVVAPAEMPTLASRAEAWEHDILEQAARIDHGLPARIVGAALEIIRDLRADATATMLHGDFYAANILGSDRGWLAIDPKGLAGPAAYDASTMIGYRYQELNSATDVGKAAQRRLEIFCEAAEVDTGLAQRLALARMVSGILWDRDHPAAASPHPRPEDADIRPALVAAFLAD
jgi:streptomycin 6-kinase